MPNHSQLFTALTATASVGRAKEANAFTPTDEAPPNSAKLQEIIGDPNTYPLSWSVQKKPATGPALEYNANSPLEGDEVFFSGLFDGAKFMDKDGTYWQILNYDFEGSVQIQDVWYPRTVAVVSIQDVRRSIHSWVEPFAQRVPPPPPGVDYGVIETRVIK